MRNDHKRRSPKIGGQFAWRLIVMLESDPYRVLSLSAHRILARLEIELAGHGGKNNGALPCTYDDFERYGVHRKAIPPAIRECVALGFVEVVERGRAGNREFRAPNKYRLTYRHIGRAQPTDEWRRIKSTAEAEALAVAARKPVESPRRQKQKTRGGKRQISGAETTPENGQFLGAETTPTAIVRKPPLLSISPVSAGAARGASSASARASTTPEGNGPPPMLRLNRRSRRRLVVCP